MNRVITDQDREWNELILKLPVEKRDIYYTKEYYLLQKRKNCESKMFVYENERGDMAIYPFLKRPIEQNIFQGEFFDIETAYGYGGPLVTSSEVNFLEEFETSFLKYCAEENIIAEFIRFHPLIKNENIFKKNIQILHNRYTVWLDLSNQIEDIWMHQISTQNRNIIRKCEKNGLKVEVGEDYFTFVEIYKQTMKKVNADVFYYFDDEYYQKIKSNENMVVLYVKKGEEIIAAAVFMVYGEFCHYHLAGSKEEFLKLSPNNLLLWEAIKYAKSRECKKFHFGGGLTDSTEDSLFRFKSRFSKEKADFYIGKRIHNQQVYNALIKQWELEHGKKAKILLQYRE